MILLGIFALQQFKSVQIISVGDILKWLSLFNGFNIFLEWKSNTINAIQDASFLFQLQQKQLVPKIMFI